MFTLNCRGKLLVIDQPIVMGIINATPDSFYSQSRQALVSEVLHQAEKMLVEGAAILDIGGQSTRPGAEMVGPEVEMERVLPSIAAIHSHFPDAVISVDSFYAPVIAAASQAGASIANDVSAGSMDDQLFATVAREGMPYICMHNTGIPAGKNPLPQYEDVLQSVLDFFIRKIATCQKAGINDFIVDPGFGFGKTTAENFELVKRLGILQILEKPVLLGVSRKSSIYKTLGITPEEALNGSTVLHTVGLLNGAHILRVHDVKEAVQAIKLLALMNDKN